MGNTKVLATVCGPHEARRPGEQLDCAALTCELSALPFAGGAHRPVGRYSIRYAWLSGRWGSLPLEGGIEAAYRADIEAADDPKAKLAEIEARLERLRSPFRTAEAFWVEEMIDPRETRPLLCEFANLAAKLRTPGPVSFGMRP